MDKTINSIKVWVAPLLFSAITYLLWQDISEMKSDVKKLLAESEYRKAVIETLKQDVDQIKKTVYYNKPITQDTKLKIKEISYFLAEDIFRFKRKNNKA
jgi:glucosamine 6-phosphate synthetase-like amidotransferase/phosphosugar isomerase protein